MHARLLSSLLLLALGFCFGWITHTLLITEPNEEQLYRRAYHEPIKTEKTQATRKNKTTQRAAANDFSATNFTAQPEKTLREKPKTSAKQYFLTLLQKRLFDQAIAWYNAIRKTDEAGAHKLKVILLEHLARYTRNENSEDFIDLTNQYLSSYYDDIDVLLALAKYNQHFGYTEETIDAFQLAFTYAHTGAYQQKLNIEFSSYVSEMDKYLSGKNAWFDLQRFYEKLEEVDLTENKHRFRLAEIYLLNGETHRATEKLALLGQNPTWKKKARELLTTSNTEKPRSQTAYSETIALAKRGSHYHVNVTIAKREDATLLIDTGASITTIAKNRFDHLAETIDFELVGPRLFNTANGMTKGYIYKTPSLTLGKLVMKNIEIAVLPYTPTIGLDGLLGMNVLRNFHFEINQDKQQLLLRSRR